MLLTSLLLLATSYNFECPEGYECDITTELQQVIDSCEIDRVENNCHIKLSAGHFRVTNPIELCGSQQIEGLSSDHTFVKTSTTGFHMPPWEQCANANRRVNQGPVKLSGLDISPSITNNDGEGIRSEHTIRIDDAIIHGYGVGIAIIANVSSNPKSNANIWAIDNTRIYNTAHAGLYIDGEDTNAGNSRGVYLTGPHCYDPNPLISRFGTCAGVVESSFLGNTHIGLHVAGTTNGYPPVRCDGPNGRNTFIGLYTELNQDACIISPKSVSIGGINNCQGAGYVQHGTEINRATFVNRNDPNHPVSLHLGENAVPWGYFTAQPTVWDGTFNLSLKHNGSNHMYYFDAGNYGPSAKHFFRAGPTSSDFQGLWDSALTDDGDFEALRALIGDYLSQ